MFPYCWTPDHLGSLHYSVPLITLASLPLSPLHGSMLENSDSTHPKAGGWGQRVQEGWWWVGVVSEDILKVALWVDLGRQRKLSLHSFNSSNFSPASDLSQGHAIQGDMYFLRIQRRKRLNLNNYQSCFPYVSNTFVALAQRASTQRLFPICFPHGLLDP